MSDGNNGNDGEKKDLEIIYQDFMNREENGNEGFYNSRKQELQIKQFYCQYLARDEPVYTEQNRSLSQKVFDQHRKMLTERFPGYKVCL